MASSSGPPPGLPRPKTPNLPPKPPLSSLPLDPSIMSPAPRRATSASWASSLSAGLFPPAFQFPTLLGTPHGTQPVSEAVSSVGCLHQPPFTDNVLITDLAVFPAPLPSDPWHIAHVRVCAHASAACAACSAAFVCCSCRALRFTPGTPPIVPSPPSQRSRSVSPSLFRSDVGNGTPPPGFNSHNNDYDDDAYAQALAEADTCDNSSCPRGINEPATYSVVVEQFDEGSEETYERIFRACSACNRACKKNFMGHRIISRTFDNSAKETATRVQQQNATKPKEEALSSRRDVPIPGSAAYAREHPVDRPNNTALFPANATQALPAPFFASTTSSARSDALGIVTGLQNALRTLINRPPTPAAFVATIRVKHNTFCTHPVDSCQVCSHGLVCCSCRALFTPAVSRRLSCAGCKHIASLCCTTAFCCMCSKMWLPTDSIAPASVPARRFYGGAGSNSSPEPDIWTPSPRSSPDKIDDLTARANVPLPASRSESDASRAPSRGLYPPPRVP